jgi:hypothetical protein
LPHASDVDADVEEDERERAEDADCGCSGVKGERFVVGVVGVDGDVGTKNCRGEEQRRRRSQRLQDGRYIGPPVAYHRYIRGFCCSLLSRYQHHERVLSTPRRDDDNPQR